MLVPGSPRPAVAEDSGVYRSLFQQPVLEVPPTTPSYAWFEFLLDPAALARHLATLRDQRRRREHGATSAMELIREFLDQAQLVADEGHRANHRHAALVRTAAHVAMAMATPLAALERDLPPHFQRLLLDGIVALAQATADKSSHHDDTSMGIVISPTAARVLHHRWALRTLARETQSGYLTATTKHDAEEQHGALQLALRELAPSHLELAQGLEGVLAAPHPDDELPRRIQSDAYDDLGVYFFAFGAYEKAHRCFARAAQLDDHDVVIDDGGDDDDEQAQHRRASRDGYLVACQSVLDMRARNEAPDASAPSSPAAQLDAAVARDDWEAALQCLESELLATSPLERCPVGQREALELRALRRLRARATAMDDAADSRRLMYKRLAISNALARLRAAIEDGALTRTPTAPKAPSDCDRALLACRCVLSRLLREEVHWATATLTNGSNLFEMLAVYALGQILAITEGLSHAPTDTQWRDCWRELARGLVELFPCLPSLSGVGATLVRLGITVNALTHPTSLDDYILREAALRAHARHQRAHYRAALELRNLALVDGAQATPGIGPLLASDTFLSALDAAPAGGTDDHDKIRSVIASLLLHQCWSALEQWLPRLSGQEHPLARDAAVAVACGSLVRFVSEAMAATPSTGATATTTTAADGPTAASTAAEVLSVPRCNKLLSDVIGSLRLRGDADDEVLLELPLWALETLVAVSAGVLHRAAMRNLSDYRVAFDLTPYGDLALVVAFGPESPGLSNKKPDDPRAESAAPVLATVAFVKASFVEVVGLHARGVQCLARRCPREPRWHSALADLAIHPLVKLKQPTPTDPRVALRAYLSAASLATNFFSDAVSVVEIIDQASLVRLSQCLVKVGAPVAAAVLYQCFGPDELKYGLRILQAAPDAHDPAHFQYFWELPFLELLVHVHSTPKHYNPRYVTLLTHLIQSPELNSANPAAVHQDIEHRILRCFFRDLCRMFLC